MSAGILLASGGLDSTTLAYWLVDRGVSVVPVFFDYGQHCVEKEWATLQRVLPPNVELPRRINIADIFAGSSSRLIREADLWTETVSDSDLYLPYRTLLFFSVAVSIAQSVNLGEVYSAFINSNHAKELDCSAVFLNSIEALSENIGRVRIQLPFREMSKSDVVQFALQLGVPIGATFSCQVFSDIPCGACPNCVERITAIASMEQEL